MPDMHRSPNITKKGIEIDFSAASMWLKCGKQYDFRYNKGMKDIPGIARIEGSSHHKTVEKNNLHKIKTRRDMLHKTLTEMFMLDLRTRINKEERVDWAGEDENGIFARAKTLYERYTHDAAPLIHPDQVEAKFEKKFKVDGLPITVFGTVDFTTLEDRCVWDLKTKAKAMSQSEVENSLQFSLYSAATTYNKVSVLQFIKSGNPHVEISPSYRNSIQRMWALRVLKSVADAIQAGSFPLADPSSWACSQRWCGYWDKCRGAGKHA